MKKYFLVIISILILMIDFIFNWYHYEIMYTILNHEILILIYPIFRIIFLIIFSLIFLKILKKSFMPNYRVLDRINLLILIFYILFMFSTNINVIKTRFEFKKYLNDRIKLINNIKKEKITGGNIKLTGKYKKLASYRSVKIYENDASKISISFVILSSSLSRNIELLYSNDIKNILEMQNVERILKIRDNWYYIEF